VRPAPTTPASVVRRESAPPMRRVNRSNAPSSIGSPPHRGLARRGQRVPRPRFRARGQSGQWARRQTILPHV
jgi:hypothetical protein